MEYKEYNPENEFNQFPKNKNNSKTKKFFMIILTSLLLLIPLAFMSGIIESRTNYRNEAINNIENSWAKKQIFDIPSMYFETVVARKDKDNNPETETLISALELNDYETNVIIKTEMRKKGIFKVPVYTAEVTQKGNFRNYFGDLSSKNITTKIFVSDARGFITEPSFKINNEPPQIVQGTEYTTRLHTKAELIPFEISYKIKGLNSLAVNLGGSTNKISINGNWANPSFEGDFLPTERTVTDKDFSAVWSVPKIALTDKEDPYSSYSATVSLLVPVDNYSMAERSVKYGFLLLSLTFLGYFIFEITSKDKKKIHPIQYCLLGGAMLIFYLLLVSISEFLNFGLAYLISSLLVISLIALYTYFVITKKNNLGFTAGITALIGLLYAFFYILLTLQDIALLAGSIGIFFIIAIAMYITRNVDWYNENE